MCCLKFDTVWHCSWKCVCCLKLLHECWLNKIRQIIWLYIESGLHYEPETQMRLIRDLKKWNHVLDFEFWYAHMMILLEFKLGNGLFLAEARGWTLRGRAQSWWIFQRWNQERLSLTGPDGAEVERESGMKPRLEAEMTRRWECWLSPGAVKQNQSMWIFPDSHRLIRVPCRSLITSRFHERHMWRLAGGAQLAAQRTKLIRRRFFPASQPRPSCSNTLWSFTYIFSYLSVKRKK